MKPYYDDGKGIVIYHGDCREILPTLDKFDLCLSDPPYGVLSKNGSAATRRSGGNIDDGKIKWDVAPSKDEISAVIYCAMNAMIWGGLHLYLPPTFGYLVWDKQIDGLNFGEAEVCWTTLKFAPRIFRFRAVSIDGGKQHPTQKPCDLMRWCLSFDPDCKTVIDPFMGSGTTLRAYKDLGKQCVGIEREEKYCEIAAIRLRQEVLTL